MELFLDVADVGDVAYFTQAYVVDSQENKRNV